MISVKQIAWAVAGLWLLAGSARAEEGFPFGSEMTLEALPQAGSKRIPNIEIGDHGEVVLELWCKGGKGQFSVAGNTVIFVPGQIQDRSCPPGRAQADDEARRGAVQCRDLEAPGRRADVDRPEVAAVQDDGKLNPLSCPGRAAACNAAAQSRDPVTHTRLCSQPLGPGSAAHH